VTEKIGEGYVEARLDMSKLGRDTSELESRVGKSFQDVGKQLQQTGKTLTTRVTAPLMGLGAVILKTAGDYQSSMNQVRAVTGATGDEFDALGNLAQELGRTTQYSAAQAADAMYFLASAGFDTNQVMEALPGVLQLAAAAQMDLATASDIASNILSAFGLEASELGRINDGLVATFQATNTNVAQLGEAMKYAAPVAQGLGVDFEEVAAAIGLMGNAGIQGSMAGSSLRMAMTSLAQETGPAADIMERLGINAMDASGQLLPLDEIVQQLENSGASAADMMDLFGQRAGPAMMALVSQGSEALGELTGNIRESGGLAQEVADIQMEGLNGAMARLRSAAEGAAIAIGESGLLDDMSAFAEVVAGMFQKLAETNPELLKTITMAAGIAATIGPATWAIGGMTTAFGKLLTVGLNPYVIAIGAAVTVLGLFVRSKMDARTRINELRDSLDEHTGALTDNTRELAVNRLEQEGAIDAARILGVSVKDLTDAALGNEDAMRRVQSAASETWSTLGDDEDLIGARDRTVELDEAMRLLEGVLPGVANEVRQASDEWREHQVILAESEGKIHDVEHALESGLTRQMYNLHAAHGEAGAAADSHGEQVEGLAGEFDLLEDEIVEAIDAMQEYIDEVRAAEDPVFALDKALQAVDDAQQSYNEAVKEYGKGSEEAQRASMDLMARISDLERAAIDGDLSFAEFDRRLQMWVDRGVITGKQADDIRSRVDNLRGAAEKYSGEYIATIIAETAAALNNLQAIRDAVYGIPTHRRIVIETALQGQAGIGVRSVPGVNQFLASGGPFRPGWAVVGEEGPELVRFDGTGEVFDAQQTSKMLSGPDLSALMSAPAAPATVDAASTPAGMSYAPQYVFNVEPTPEALAMVRHRERVAYMEMR
jgi:TP901 family phage tail tape measure protein